VKIGSLCAVQRARRRASTGRLSAVVISSVKSRLERALTGPSVFTFGKDPSKSALLLRSYALDFD
jgi:hypothetical protein